MLMTAATIALAIVRITGPAQVVLGVLLWIGYGSPVLLRIHMLVGMTFVLALWALAGLAARAGLRWSLVAAAVGWGGVVPVFGILQTRLVPGPAHWTVEVAHLLIGLAAMLLAARLARFVRERAQGVEGWARPGRSMVDA